MRSNALSLEGQKFGSLTVIRRHDLKKGPSFQWECKCDCGKSRIVIGSSLKSGTIKTCGCGNRPSIINNKFKHLVVIEFSKNKHKYKCLCDCGEITYKSRTELCDGSAISCGCSSRFRDREGMLWKEVRRNTKRRADKYNLQFELSINDVKHFGSQPCHYCGLNYSHNKQDRFYSENGIEIFYNGLDRVDSNIGYILNNIVPCCYDCNVAKSDMSLLEFKEWLNNIYNKFCSDGK